MSDNIIDSSSSLDAVYDGLHGYIALGDMSADDGGQIRRLLGAPFLQRLRRIKQLGFVSQSFLSAEHNRYAHALGTMQMMRSLIVRLSQSDTKPELFWSSIILDVEHIFPFLKDKGDFERKRGVIFQHLLVTSLLQDVGEYPYAKATEFFFRPDERVRTFIRSKFLFNVDNMTNKALMTLAVIFDQASERYIEGLSPELLVFLLSNNLKNGVKCPPGLKILRHMLDGAIDADRLDYVYRDSYHTLGDVSIATPIIDSLITYTERGPILKHVRPITEFLAKRALLWCSIYNSPENRFRIILLRLIFKELRHNDELTCEIFNSKKMFSCNEETFYNFDDRHIEEMIETLSKHKLDIHPNVDKAINLLSEGSSKYEYRWVRLDLDKECDLNRNEVFPNFFYFDRYSDYLTHSLYDQKSIRVMGSRYEIGDKRPDDGTVYLEQCVGPFGKLLSDNWSSHPMPGHMAWFQPNDSNSRSDDSWGLLEKFRKGEDNPVLLGQFIIDDPMLDEEISFDTRKDPTCKPPNIFISFRWSDYKMVHRISAILKKNKRRFYGLCGDYIGFGGTIISNSEKAVKEAGAVIILYSESYADRYRDYPASGAIAAEILEMTKRSKDLPIAILSMEPHEKLGDKLPWHALGLKTGNPAVGKPLRSASDYALQTSIADALEYIDRHYNSNNSISS